MAGILPSLKALHAYRTAVIIIRRQRPRAQQCSLVHTANGHSCSRHVRAADLLLLDLGWSGASARTRLRLVAPGSSGAPLVDYRCRNRRALHSPAGAVESVRHNLGRGACPGGLTVAVQLGRLASGRSHAPREARRDASTALRTGMSELCRMGSTRIRLGAAIPRCSLPRAFLEWQDRPTPSITRSAHALPAARVVTSGPITGLTVAARRPRRQHMPCCAGCGTSSKATRRCYTAW